MVTGPAGQVSPACLAGLSGLAYQAVGVTGVTWVTWSRRIWYENEHTNLEAFSSEVLPLVVDWIPHWVPKWDFFEKCKIYNVG